MQIGRKIYYELNTGNVVLITSSLNSDVVETTKEQDMTNYSALQPYEPTALGVIQLEYGGIDEQNSLKYPCHVDISTNQIVWDIANPYGATLPEVQAAKIAQIEDLYKQKLEAGFTSNATGAPYVFGYGVTDREKFMQLSISVLSGIATFPVPIPAKDNTIVMHDQTQYQQLLADINAFAWLAQNRLHELTGQVQACTTVDEVNAIVVSF